MKKIIFIFLNFLFILNISAGTIYEHLYIVGNATKVGWNPSAAIELTKLEKGIFTWTGTLRNNVGNNERFKFLVGKDWYPSITCRTNIEGNLLLNAGSEYDLYERPHAEDGYDNAFQIASLGTYTIHLNLNTMKIICTKISDEIDDVNILYTKETLKTSSGETLNYRKLSPPSLEQGQKYPLVIFLHGAGERGSNNNSQLTHGAEQFVKIQNRKNYPAFVLFPQCPSSYFWPFASNPPSYTASTFPVDYPIAPAIQQVKELLDMYMKMDQIDKDRVYILGISMGGMGTFDLVCRFPEIFAAAIPICGGINIDRLTDRVKNVYWRIFHGNADGTVPVKNSRDANSKLQEIGASVEYIELENMDHNSWDAAFAREDFLPWLFSKTRKTESKINMVADKHTPIVYQIKGNLCIETEGSGRFQVNLYALSGKKIYAFPAETINGLVDKEYLLPILESGIYLVEIQVDNNRSFFKIII